MTIIVVQIGARNHYLTAECLYDMRLLTGLYTDVYVDASNPIHNAKRFGLTQKHYLSLCGRSAFIPTSHVRSFPSVYLGQKLGAKLFADRVSNVNISVADFLGRRIRDADLESAQAVYSFSTASRVAFERADGLGIGCLLEQSSATVETTIDILLKEHQKWPNLFEIPISKRRKELADYQAVQRVEIDLADRIFAPSPFVENSLLAIGTPREKIVKLPYGMRLPAIARPEEKQPKRKRNLNILYVGSINPLKGAQYLLSALERLDMRYIHVRFLGDVQMPLRGHFDINKNVEFFGRVPRSEVALHYEWADLLCTPTLCEGFGFSAAEAIAHGVPVLATTILEGLVKDNITGLLVPPGNTQTLVDTIMLLQEDEKLLNTLSTHCVVESRKFCRQVYSKKLKDILSSMP